MNAPLPNLIYDVRVKSESDQNARHPTPEVAEWLHDGDEHLRHGRGKEAEACFRAILEREPDNPVALHRCGVIAFLRGDAADAVTLLSRALPASGDNPTLLGHLASALMACGRVDEAIASWQRALGHAPDVPGTHARLGDAYMSKGDIESSESAYRKSIALAPDAPEAYVGLGRLLHFSNRNREAEEALHRALEVDNTNPETWILVGTVLLEAGGLDAALELFEAAARTEPDSARAHAGRGLALHWLGRGGEAQDAYERALSIDPRSALALKHLGVLLQERNQLAAAAECFERLLEVNPGDEVAVHMLAATSGKTTVRAPAGYVTRLFDDYADRFDEHLGSIAYRVPTLIREAIADIAGEDATGLSVLDLGCGTGLCGEVVRPMAEFLAGVDLSSRMIAKARERHIYDSLLVASIEDALSDQEPRYDLIIAGDVFTYVGDLASVLAGCARVLLAKGLVVFSVESAIGGDYQLRPTGRYAHTPDYIDKTAAASGLTVAYQRDIILRNDPGPIPGRILVLSRVA